MNYMYREAVRIKCNTESRETLSPGDFVKRECFI